eukprot:6177133-Pleurochrysis_carterae.AAC.3
MRSRREALAQSLRASRDMQACIWPTLLTVFTRSPSAAMPKPTYMHPTATAATGVGAAIAVRRSGAPMQK